MSKQSTVWGISILLCIMGCDPGYPDDPPVARRHMNGMTIGSVYSQSSTDGANSRPEGDLHLDHWARFKINNEPMQLGNQRMDIYTEFIWRPAGAGFAIPQRPYRSNRRGYCVWPVPLNNAPAGSFQCDYTTYAACPRAGGSIGGSFGRVATLAHPSPGYMEPLDYMFKVYDYAGTYWMSGSQIGDGHLSLGQLNGPPRPVAGLLNLTDTDTTFLATEPNLMNDTTLLLRVADCRWEMLDAENQPQPVLQFEPIDDFRTDPNYAQLITDNSTPYYMKWHFWTKFACDLAGRTFSGVATIGDPNEPNYIEPVSITVLADGENRRSHIAVSEYMVIADPNNYAPFRVGDILIVPLSEGQRIRMEFDDWSQVVSMVAGQWLTPNPDLDQNEDGVFNYQDWFDSGENQPQMMLAAQPLLSSLEAPEIQSVISEPATIEEISITEQISDILDCILWLESLETTSGDWQDLIDMLYQSWYELESQSTE